MASSQSLLKNIINLNSATIQSYDEITQTVSFENEPHNRKTIYIHAKPYAHHQQRCPICDNHCSVYDHKYADESKWRAPNLNGIPVYICYRTCRIFCPEHGILTEKIPWADGNSRFTEDFNNEVAWLVGQMSRSAIASFLEINWRTVGNCIKAAQDRLEPDTSSRLHGLRRICVDETSYHKGFSYITVVYDMDRNRVAWIHSEHGKHIFQKFCEQLSEEERSKIEIVAGDGAKWIDTCTKEYFPNATRCIDFFHVVEWANEALDKVRIATAAKASREYTKLKNDYTRAEQAEREAADKAFQAAESARAELASMPKRGRPSRRKQELQAFLEEYDASQSDSDEKPKAAGRPRKESFSPEHQAVLDEYAKAVRNIKDSKHALGHDPNKCTESQKEKIQLIESSYPDLYRGYQLKESLRIILHMTNDEAAAIELTKWISEAKESGLKPMAELSDKIKRHEENILNSIRQHANSAKSEATNTSIKRLIRLAYGFRNIDNMIALIYLKCSDLVIPLNNRFQLNPEQAASKRQHANELRLAREARNCS